MNPITNFAAESVSISGSNASKLKGFLWKDGVLMPFCTSIESQLAENN